MADTELKADNASHQEATGLPAKVHLNEAAVASHIEHELAPWAAIKAYPSAVFWCLIVSMCVVMVVPLQYQNVLY